MVLPTPEILLVAGIFPALDPGGGVWGGDADAGIVSCTADFVDDDGTKQIRGYWFHCHDGAEPLRSRACRRSAVVLPWVF